MQTSYGINMGRYIAGQLDDLRTSVIESCIADVAMGFGLGVMVGALIPGGTYAAGFIPGPIGGGFRPGSVKLPTAGGQTFAGFTVNQHTEQTYPFVASSGQYAINDIVNVCRRGLVVVQVAANVTCAITDTVYIVSSGATAGQITNSSASSAIAATGAVFRETMSTASASATGLCLVEINLP
jgi:hypothetical protein